MRAALIACSKSLLCSVSACCAKQPDPTAYAVLQSCFVRVASVLSHMKVCSATYNAFVQLAFLPWTSVTPRPGRPVHGLPPPPRLHIQCCPYDLRPSTSRLQVPTKGFCAKLSPRQDPCYQDSTIDATNPRLESANVYL